MGTHRDEGHPKDPDGGYGWVVAGAAFVSLAIVNGLRCSFSPLYVEFSQVFDESKASLGWIGSLNVAMTNMIGLLAGKLVFRFGCRLVAIFGSLTAAIGYLSSAFATSVPVLYVTYGLIAGSGLGIMMLPAYVLVQQYFTRRRALAAGLASLGLSLGNMAIPPATSFFLQKYGWRGTLILSAGIGLQGILPAALYRPPPPRGTQISSKSQEHEIEDCDARPAMKPGILGRVRLMWEHSVLKDSYFLLCATGSFFMNFGLFTFIHHSSSRASHYDIATHYIVILLPIFGACDALSRIFFCIIANMSCVNRLAQYGMGIVFGGIITVASSFTRSFIPLAILTGMFGICSGCFLSVQQTVLGDLMGVERIAQAQGMQSLFIGMALLYAVPFAGWLFDVSHNYDIPLQVNGSLMALGGLIILLIILIQHHSKSLRGANYATGKGADIDYVVCESKSMPNISNKPPIYRPQGLTTMSLRSLNINISHSDLLPKGSVESIRKAHSANFCLANGKPWIGSRDRVNKDQGDTTSLLNETDAV